MSCISVDNWTMFQAPESRCVLRFVHAEIGGVTHAHMDETCDTPDDNTLGLEPSAFSVRSAL